MILVLFLLLLGMWTLFKQRC